MRRNRYDYIPNIVGRENRNKKDGGEDRVEQSLKKKPHKGHGFEPFKNKVKGAGDLAQ